MLNSFKIIVLIGFNVYAILLSNYNSGNLYICHIWDTFHYNCGLYLILFKLEMPLRIKNQSYLFFV